MQICNNGSNFDKIYKLVLKYLQWQLIMDTAYFEYPKYIDKSIFYILYIFMHNHIYIHARSELFIINLANLQRFFGLNYSWGNNHTPGSRSPLLHELLFCGKIQRDSFNFGAEKMALNKGFVCTDSCFYEVNVCSNLNANRCILLHMVIMSVIKPQTKVLGLLILQSVYRHINNRNIVACDCVSQAFMAGAAS